MDLGWVFGITTVAASITHNGEKYGPGCKEGEQLLLVWLSHGEKNPAPFQQLVHVAKNDVCDKKRWNQGGGKAFSSMGTATSPKA